MYGGLCCDGVSNAIKDFVFLYLHLLKRDRIAAQVTNMIREHICTEDLEESNALKRKKCFSFWSLQKLGMTEN